MKLAIEITPLSKKWTHWVVDEWAEAHKVKAEIESQFRNLKVDIVMFTEGD